MKYQKKPEIVEAEQFTGDNNPFGLDANFIAHLHAEKGDWILKGVNGFFAMTNKYLQEEYEAVEESALCDVEGCDNHRSCGGAFWKEAGYWVLCDKHFIAAIKQESQPKMKQEAIDREKLRGKDGVIRK